MTQKDFMIALRRSLKDIPTSDVDKIVEYYDEIIADRMEEGMAEETAVAAMGNLEDIVANVRIEAVGNDSTKKYGKWFGWRSGVVLVMVLLISVITIAGDIFGDIDDWFYRSEMAKEVEVVTQAEIIVADTEIEVRFHNGNMVKVIGREDVIAWFTVSQVKGELKIVQETWDYITEDDDLIIYLPQGDYSLSLHSSSGDIEIKGYAGNNLTVTSGNGSVDLQLRGNKSEYTVKAQSIQGEIEALSGEGDKLIEIYTHTGDIEVEYNR